MEILQGLNEVQKQALLQTEGSVLVTAGAGSGKTKLLTHRIAYLINDLGVCEDNILAITFTNKAANEMRDRVSKLLDRKNSVWISTFHAMCLKILRKHIAKLDGYTTEFSVYDEQDSEKTLKQVIKDLNLSNDDYKHFAKVISVCQNENIDIYAYSKNHLEEQDELIKVYEKYEETLKNNNAIDFDHLLSKTYELFMTNKSILDYYSNKFRYIFIDEFQDTNKIQYDLIKLISHVNKNVFVVGDEDQCIYTWRGANFQNIFNFKTDFAPVKMFKLEQNYRSTKSILEKANKLIKNNTERFDKVLWTDNDEGKNVECNEYYDEQREAENIASKILMLKTKYGYKNSDFAILMRLNALTLPFEQKMLNYNIPYRIYGGVKFYERQEIKNLMAYLKILCNPNDDTSLLRIINFPRRAIGDVAIQKYREYAQSKNMPLLVSMQYLCEHSEENPALASKINGLVCAYNKVKKLCEEQALPVLCKSVIQEFNIKSAYEEKSDENTERLMNIDMFVNSAHEYVKANGNVSLSEYLESITLETDLDFMGDDTVTISTVHSVKGLEFKVVFIVGTEDGIFPLSRCYESERELEEERRLMYVAMTRAMERLFISYTECRYLHGNRQRSEVSRFIEEVNLLPYNKPKIHTSYFEDDYGVSYDSEYRASGYGNNYTNSYSKPSYNNFVKPKVDVVKRNETIKVSTYKDEVSEEIPKVSEKGKFQAGQSVKHPKYGEGKVIAIIDDGECAEIDFNEFGKKTLILALAPLELI